MTAPALCCSPDDSLERVAQLMWDYEIRALPVIDRAGRPTGWVSDRAICMSALRARRALSPLEARQAMLLTPPTVHCDLPVHRLEREMAKHDTQWLIVVDDRGVVVGIVTAGDVDQALRALGRRTVAALRFGAA